MPLLRGVRSSGRDSWRADCPVGHQHARGSLSVTVADDGRILMHCFACGDALTPLRALGLELRDLFVERIKDPSPEARRAAHDAYRRNAWGAALGVLVREATIVACAAGVLRQGHALTGEDEQRLALAVDRIGFAREVLHGR
ncbi:MAG: hypothetical protein JSS45_06550 [Proteobacteria bacterium]|nr:hypothetical protein [Pseudomonadota bacterium]